MRAVITGIGPVTPIGVGRASYLAGLREGYSGIGPITRFDASAFGSRVAAELRDFRPEQWVPEAELARTDRYQWYALAALQLALRDADLEPARLSRHRTGIVFGTALGGAEFAERALRQSLASGLKAVPRDLYRVYTPGALVPYLRSHSGARGPTQLISTGCTAGTDAIGEAARKIRRGEADVMIAGGSDASLTPSVLACFDVIGALSRHNEDPLRASRPFDATRDGFVLAEGAGVVILESIEHARARRAPQVYAEVRGFGAASNAHHMTAPDPEAVQNARAVRLALERAGVRPADVDYVNAHGSSTSLNDVAETRMMKRVFGDAAYGIPISSTKSQTGHPLGAAGVIEAIACALAIRHAFLPPTLHYGSPDPDCDLDYVPNASRAARVDVALSNACAFGGLNSVLVLAGGAAW